MKRANAMGISIIRNLFLCLALVLAAGSTAAAADKRIASNHATFKGAPFFLLSDASYGSADVARVRLEIPGRDYARAGLEAYGGVDLHVYRVPAPLDFLKQQRNLHRVEVRANYRGEGLANTLRYLWDSWWKQSRLVWRRIFSADARSAVVEVQPKLATGDAIARPTQFRHDPQYKPLKGYELIDSFRYPVWQAKPVEAPAGVKLEGSSSEFLPSGGGNLLIPIGKRKPGLYLVEAMVGEHRATTLVFVSDTMAVTKVSSNQMLVWTARRDSGASVPASSVAWTDGSGVLQSGTTDDNGVLVLERGSPERTYVMGEDRDGGVFISENFYYDSEIHANKIYAVTDRPLYRPGDEVQVKFMAREFTSARASQPVRGGPLRLEVFDPNGTPLLTQDLQLSPATGSETRFRLPDSAGAGGYELRFVYQDDVYSAALRVAQYVKPHFEIDVQPSRQDIKTGQIVDGTIALRYPDGKPVKNATLSLSLRAQKNSMAEGELRYSGLFPVSLTTQELKTDGSGNAAFKLPPALDPSRYILTVLATDGAAYRVRVTRELLIERSPSRYWLKAARRFSAPGEKVRFDVTPEPGAVEKPVRWELLRLEDRSQTAGAFAPTARNWDVSFPGPGSYQLNLRDERGNLLGAASHWVSGDGVQTVPGSIEIVLDRARYQPGEVAEALITFSEPVDQALITLERDKVEHYGTVRAGAGWFQARRLAPRQWLARIPVRDEYGPNMTLSVAHTRGGELVFENAGLLVVQPRIALQFKADKDVYLPGDTVTLDILAQLDGKPLATAFSLGVVDEMVYVLQPEIVPDIVDFFHHPRRNNVRTTASSSFISYDMAQARSGAAPARHNYNERAVKVLERPRRAEVDTAFWAPSLSTDADGRAQVRFTMPDALTRWRITGRAMDAEGRVGQRTAYLRSDKPYYAKWTAPNWLRAGDAPRAAVALFNQTGKEQALELTMAIGAERRTEKLAARPGVNHVEFALTPGLSPVRLEVRQQGRLVDAVDAPVRTLPNAWNSAQSQLVRLTGASTPLALPPGARDVRVAFVHGAAGHLARIADDLLDQPYGGVEQTASRLIPLAMALQGMAPQAQATRARLLDTLQGQRLRLVNMAGPRATFGWWGNQTEADALMTAYAYYADWLAARTLGIEIPPNHWHTLLSTYQQHGLTAPLQERALVLWLAHEMGLPTRNLAQGLVADAAEAAPPTAAPARAATGATAGSLLLDTPAGGAGDAMGLALLALVAGQNGAELPAPLQQQVDAAWSTLAANPAPLAQSLQMLAGRLPASQADAVLAAVRAEMPGLDRTLALVWVGKALGAGAGSAAAPEIAPDGLWQAAAGRQGPPSWRWLDAKAPPRELRLAQPAPEGTVALVRYTTPGTEAASLPVRVARRLTLLEPGDKGYVARPVKAGEALRSDALYLDEITLSPAAGARHRFGLLEVALPPGASVESSTWGIALRTGDKTEELERARHVERQDGYAVPVDALAGPLTVRHLLRFSQKGRFVLPPARFARVYQPDQVALEAEPLRALTVE